MLPGWCCIANRHIGARERRQLIPHVRFQVPFLGPESQLKSGFACAGLLCSSLSGMVMRTSISPLGLKIGRASPGCKNGVDCELLEIVIFEYIRELTCRSVDIVVSHGNRYW